ncbi:hypothetical protein D3C87_1832680 [compost metagenome]
MVEAVVLPLQQIDLGVFVVASRSGDGNTCFTGDTTDRPTTVPAVIDACISNQHFLDLNFEVIRYSAESAEQNAAVGPVMGKARGIAEHMPTSCLNRSLIPHRRSAIGVTAQDDFTGARTRVIVHTQANLEHGV